jgi:hypothetical protein
MDVVKFRGTKKQAMQLVGDMVAMGKSVTIERVRREAKG